mgnify:CR=1 FL=1
MHDVTRRCMSLKSMFSGGYKINETKKDGILWRVEMDRVDRERGEIITNKYEGKFG